MSEATKSYPSFVVTGMSATGKSTLIRRILDCQAYSSAHLSRVTTRDPRQSDLQGEYEHVNPDTFLEHFKQGRFLEPTLWHAEMGDYLYGSPAEWLNVLEQGGQIASPPSIAVADCIKQRIGTSVAWIHLHADTDVREQRLRERGHSAAEIATRLTVYEAGSDEQLPEVDMNIDTGVLGVDESLVALNAFAPLANEIYTALPLES